MFHQALAVNVEQQVIVSQMARGRWPATSSNPKNAGFTSTVLFYLPKKMTVRRLNFYFTGVRVFRHFSGILSGIFSDILSGIYSGILSGILYICHSFQAFYLASILTFYSAILSGIHSASIWHLFWHSLWHGHCRASTTAHWDLALATEIWSSRWRLRKDEEDEEEEKVTLIKSRDSHLTGGEKPQFLEMFNRDVSWHRRVNPWPSFSSTQDSGLGSAARNSEGCHLPGEKSSPKCVALG